MTLPMQPDENLAARILSSLARLSTEEQTEAVLALIGATVKTMSVYRLLEIRQEIRRELDPELPIVQSALTVIEGQIALREIAGEDNWR